MSARLRKSELLRSKLIEGGLYISSRERSPSIEIDTPSVNGFFRGTQVVVRVTPTGKAIFSVLEGEVELVNSVGRVTLRSGEQGEAEIGKAPHKTAVIVTTNLLQWALYYPGVLDPGELGLSRAEQASVAASLAAYRVGDLLGALEKYPKNHRPNSAAARLYQAGVVLAVGRVDEARRELAGVRSDAPGRRALEEMIAAVNFVEHNISKTPSTASEWLARSYYLQSRDEIPGRLEKALDAARRAAALAPDFGYAAVRVAELEFSQGRIEPALRELARNPRHSARNAQAHALRGFLLSAQNRIDAAHAEFQTAIDLDGALGNAWLGRGLCAIRQGRDDAGRLDLQIAATVEPNRSILHSYLGKAFSEIGDNKSANKDLARAKELDLNDPTPWLYSAIQRKQENRYNEAIDDLEKSIELNENRRLYRSEFLLDQDLAIRNANLASIYRNNGMIEQSVREAVRAVNNDYASAPAHLFLSNSYDALRDPSRILLRYESAWSSELLLANLLSPVGGGSLSQFVSQQEYSKLFEKDGLGISSLTEWSGDGKFLERASQFGTYGNLSYALDAEYYYDNGLRPNNKLSRTEVYATFKLQLGSQDSLFFQIKPYFDFEGGDLSQRYDPSEVDRGTTTFQPSPGGGLTKVVTKNVAALTYDFHEKQEPGRTLIGWHHEWSPGNHTLLLAGRLANQLHVTDQDTPQLRIQRDVLSLLPKDFDVLVTSPGFVRDEDFFSRLDKLRENGRTQQVNQDIFDYDYRSAFEIYSVELQQIATLGPDTLVLGARYQRGEFDTHVRLTDYANGSDPFGAVLFRVPPASQDVSVDFNRISLYAYNTLHIAPWLSLTGGVAYDHMKFPENFQNPPINDRQESLNRVSPKAGLMIQPWRGATIRGAYTEFIGGVSFDENLRLEPPQVAGFLQSYRSLVSENLISPISGSKYKVSGLSFEQKLPTRTYLGVEYEELRQDADRAIGVFDSLGGAGSAFANLPSSLKERDSYREDLLTATITQLVGDNWSLGSRYRYTRARLRQQRPALNDGLALGLNDPFAARDSLTSLAANGDRLMRSNLHELNLFVAYNHPSGFFGRFEANWYQQENDDFVKTVEVSPAGSKARIQTQNLGLAGDAFWQLNLFAGYRFHRNQCEISLGVLNLNGEDYHLTPLTPHLELPRDRTLFFRCKLVF